MEELLQEFRDYEPNEMASEEDQETLMRTIIGWLKKNEISVFKIEKYKINIPAPQEIDDIEDKESVCKAVTIRLQALGGVWASVTVSIEYEESYRDNYDTYICLK